MAIIRVGLKITTEDNPELLKQVDEIIKDC